VGYGTILDSAIRKKMCASSIKPKLLNPIHSQFSNWTIFTTMELWLTSSLLFQINWSTFSHWVGSKSTGDPVEWETWLEYVILCVGKRGTPVHCSLF